MVGVSPLWTLNWPPIIKILNGLRWGGTPIKISNWGDKIIKIAEKLAKILWKGKKWSKIFLPPTIPHRKMALTHPSIQTLAHLWLLLFLTGRQSSPSLQVEQGQGHDEDTSNCPICMNSARGKQIFECDKCGNWMCRDCKSQVNVCPSCRIDLRSCPMRRSRALERLWMT